MPHISNIAMICFILGLACVIFVRAGKFKENIIIGATFIGLGITTNLLQSRPWFMSTHDNELVAFRRPDGKLNFNMKSAANHYFAFDTFLQISGNSIEAPRHKHRCSRGVCEFQSDKINIVYTQRFIPLLKNFDTWCADDNVDYIVSYLNIDAPKCEHKILKGAFIIYDNGRIKKFSQNRYWHKHTQHNRF